MAGAAKGGGEAPPREWGSRRKARRTRARERTED